MLASNHLQFPKLDLDPQLITARIPHLNTSRLWRLSSRKLRLAGKSKGNLRAAGQCFCFQWHGILKGLRKYIYGTGPGPCGPPPPPPPMVWVQNLHFGYIFMEPAKTHGIYNVLTSSASETVVFAAFCILPLYTTNHIVVLLRINPHSKFPHPPPTGGRG